jgi:hypothetical protein
MNRAPRGPFTARLSGARIVSMPEVTFNTVAECRRWAEDHGAEADRCTIFDVDGRPVAAHERDRAAPHWFDAYV